MGRNADYTLEVLSPGSQPVIATGETGRSIDDLAGKTIGFISDYAFRAEEMFALIENELSKRHRSMRFVPSSMFGDVHGHDERAVIAAMPGRIRSQEVDGVVVGVGA